MAKNKEVLTAQQSEKLLDLCIDIYAHAKNDYEITLGGNGTNACEASNVAGEIESILGVKHSSLSTRISKRATELRKLYE